MNLRKIWVEYIVKNSMTFTCDNELLGICHEYLYKVCGSDIGVKAYQAMSEYSFKADKQASNTANGAKYIREKYTMENNIKLKEVYTVFQR